MVEIRIRESRITARGHATGSVEACAGASALLCALGGYLEGLGEAVEVRLDSGEAVVSLSDRAGEKAVGAFEMACEGLRRLGDRYGEFVQVIDDKR